jgi:DNA-binding PadR family transcriptional regulator
MRFLVEEKGSEQKAFKVSMIKNPEVFSILSNKLTLKILEELGKEPSCPMDLARRLQQHEQKIYYHVRRLEKLGLIEVKTTEERVGAIAKIYAPTTSIVAFKLFDSEPIRDVKTRAREIEFLKPFIENGRLNSLIVIGSPDPHGKYKAPASDGYCAINLAMFLGQFITKLPIPFYKLDTQITEKDKKKNLILIGGPKTNTLVYEINKNLPIYFDYSEEFLDWSIVSSLSKNVYREKQIGFVTRIPSPFWDEAEILLFAGKGFRGTMASIMSFILHSEEIQKGNSFDKNVIAKVVRGVDIDSDGFIDEVEFLE